MNKTSKQLEAVFQEITSNFGDNPEIIVTPGEGSPPEEYTITYHKRGACKDENGEISTCDTHVITISLPFGFPHFPPNCLPKSNTFHPDFDSSAICIGDVWEADQSITKLILHIGRMIAGEIYSESNAFNEEAAEWYKENSNRLPFKKQASRQETATTPGTVTAENIETIDTLDDEDFGESFSLEDDSPSDTVFDKKHIDLLVNQKRFHTLSQELQKIDELFDGRGDLEKQAQTSLNKAATIFREVETLEQLGKQEEALKQLHSLEELVSDYPDLQKARKRIQQASDLADSEGNETEHDIDAPDSEEAPIVERPEPFASKPAPKVLLRKIKSAPRKGILFTLGGVILVLTAAAFVFFYFSFSSTLEEAEKHYAECQNLLNSGDFKGANQECKTALELTAKVVLIKQSKKEQLTGDIRTLLSSKKLRQGLAGKTLLNGKYVSQASKESILKFMEAKEEGDAFFEEERWENAALSYEKALILAAKMKIDKKLLEDILEKQSLVHLNTIRQAAEESIVQSDWKAAAEHFDEALELAKTLPNFPPEDMNQLELLAQHTKFEILRNHGQELFEKNEWETALDSYQRALALAKKLDMADSPDISNLHKNIVRTEIYMAIAKGKEAFAAAQWDTVIVHYKKAIALLEENATLLSATNIIESGEKLARILLHATIIRDKQDLAKYLKSEDFNQAIKQLQIIKQTITSSQFADQPEFQTILKEISSQITETEQKVLILEQTAYLTDNYEKLFVKHYPAASRSILSAPRIEYIRDMDNKLLFRMQCTETTGGRPLRLQMDYLYSPTSDSWQFYSEE
ncbi:MAG: hypothetical protein K9K37_12625 [Desulfocapsa sp.]|nr:hypothetical protein [Desulfocapsa sp.]